MIDPPKRTGYRLTYDAECLYNDWQEIGGCTCFLGCAPCSSCCSEGHPISLEENDEAWELDEDWARKNLTWQMIADDTSPYGRNRGYKDMARDNITDKSSPPKSEWFGYKYRVTPETSKLLQEAVFKDGGGWGFTQQQDVINTDKPFLVVRQNKEITFTADEDYFEHHVSLPEKQPPLPQEFKVGKYYKYILQGLGVFKTGGYYKLSKANGGLLFTEDMYRYMRQEAFDINSESDYDPNAKESVDTEVKDVKIGTPKGIIEAHSRVLEVVTTKDVYYDSTGKWVVPKEYEGADLTLTYPIQNYQTKLTKFNQQEEIDMSTNTQRKTVTVNLIDRDTALDEKFALVATFGEFTTSKSSEALIRSIIIDPKNDVAKLIAQHNEVRTKQTNKEILDRTGNKVTLEAVEESDLYWEIR